MSTGTLAPTSNATPVRPPRPAATPPRQELGASPQSFAALLGEQRADTAGAEEPPAAAHDGSKSDRERDTATAADAGTPDWLASLHALHGPAAGTADGAAAAGDDGALSAPGRGHRPAGRLAHAGGAAGVHAGRMAAPAPDKGAAPADEAPAGPIGATASLATTATAAEAPAADPVVPLLRTAEPAPAAVMPAATLHTPPVAEPSVAAHAAPATGPEAMVSVPVPTPLDHPEFGHALGVQVSVLAREGVQTAELRLNPAEMGPVTVQIALDGTQARVEFGADVAVTRQAIEHSLPDLAAALREAGLTLAGGGVSQQSHQRAPRDGGSPSGDGSRAGPGREPGVTAVTAAPPRRVVTVGGLDLYA